MAGRKNNPYDTGGKARRSGPDLWEYKGYLIHARKVTVVGGDPGDHYIAQVQRANWKKTLLARDLASAVERARLAIDFHRYVNNLSVDQQAMFGRIGNRIDDYIEIYAPGGRPGAGRPTALANRSVTARVLQKYFDEARQVMADPSSSAGDKYAAEYALEGAKFFNNLSVQDRLKWIDARIEDKRLWYGLPKKNPRKKAKKNPYDTKQKMQNVGPDLWSYRGYEIRISRQRGIGGLPVFAAKIKRVGPPPKGDFLDEMEGAEVPNPNETSLLEIVRLRINNRLYKASLSPIGAYNFRRMDHQIENAYVDVVYRQQKPPTRANVSRQLEVLHQKARVQVAGGPEDLYTDPKDVLKAYAFFNGLPVKDRIAWLNAQIKEIKLVQGLPLKNPRKKAKKKVSRVKKNPYDTKQKMQNIASDLWKYRGHEIEVLRDVDIDGNRVFHAKITRVAPLSPDQEDMFGERDDPGKYLHKDVPDALEMARLAIDRAEYRASLPPGAKRKLFDGMFLNIAGAFYRLRGDPVAPITKSPSRAAVAREMELLSRKARGRTRLEYTFFNMQSVKDRTAWLDAGLKELRLQEGLPLTKNPRKKAKKKVSRRKKNPYDTKQKMQNVGSDLWTYRGYEIQMSRKTSSIRRGRGTRSVYVAQITRVGPSPGKHFYDDLDGGAFSHEDETTLLEMIRLRIDEGIYRASLSPTNDFNFRRMSKEISAAFVDVVTYQQKSPTRANVTRQIEKLHQKARRQVTIGAGTPFSDPKDALKAFGFFNGLPVKDRLAWVDAKIKELKLSIPLTNPRIGGKKRKRRRLSPGEVARLLSPEGQREMEERDRAIKGELLHRIIRDIIKDFHENGKQISRAAVSRRLQEIFSGGRHQHIADFITGEKAFNAMPVSERLNLIDTEISAYKTKHGITNPRKKAKKKVSRRKKNPYDTKAKMRNIASDLWKYRGYEIKTQRGPWGKGGKPRFVATIDRVDPHQHPGYDILDNRQISHGDEVALLELARLRIDRDLYMRGLSEGDQRSAVDIESEIEYAFTDVHSTQRKALTRANVSRRLEVVRDEAKGILGPKGHARVKAFEFFDSLPLKDRLSWVDARIKDLKIQYGLPLTNPRKKAKKKVSRRKKNPEDWDFTEAKRRLRKARHALENADRGGYRGEGVASRGSILSDYTRAYQEAAMGVFILNRMIFLDIDASRAKRALWAQSAKGVMQGEGEALDVFWNTTEAVFRQCGIRITPEMKGTLSLHFIGSVSKDLQSWKARPTGDTILPSPEDLDSWISAASLTITKWKHGQKPRMKREEQILFLLDVLASTFIIATAAPKLQPRGQREKDKAPRLLIPSIALGIDAQDLLAAECKEGQRERARVKHAKGRSGNPKEAPTAKELVAKCQKLWEAYCKKPGVTKLRAVAKHCEAMKASKAKTVTKERQGCLRSIRAEAKSRGWKL